MKIAKVFTVSSVPDPGSADQHNHFPPMGRDGYEMWLDDYGVVVVHTNRLRTRSIVIPFANLKSWEPAEVPQQKRGPGRPPKEAA